MDHFVFPFPENHFQKEGKVKLTLWGSEKENKSLKKEKMGDQIWKIWTETKLKILWLNAQFKFNFIIFKVAYHYCWAYIWRKPMQKDTCTSVHSSTINSLDVEVT